MVISRAAVESDRVALLSRLGFGRVARLGLGGGEVVKDGGGEGVGEVVLLAQALFEAIAGALLIV